MKQATKNSLFTTELENTQIRQSFDTILIIEEVRTLYS